MLVILPLLCFGLFVATYAARSREWGPLTRWRTSFLSAALTWGLAVAVSTEMLSLFQLITLEWIASFWIGLFVLAAILCCSVSTRDKARSLFQFPSIPRFDLWCLGGVASITVIAGLVAYIAPPNNADSIFYHMARVVHWIQNQTVAHYPTNIPHQLVLPPWSGFAIMHFQILHGGDQWANFVQWFSMIGSIIGVSLLAKELGAEREGQVLAAVITATIPMGILQASSTQNDYVTAFWLVCLMYYIFRFQTEPSFPSAVGVGASLGLALLTKPTAYMYALPLIIWFIVSGLAGLRWRSWKTWQTFVLTGVLALSINIGHFVRNVDLSGNPFGAEQGDPHPNQSFGVAVIVSNAIRGISVHIGTRSLQLNEVIGDGVQALHRAFGIDLNDRRTTFSSDFYQNWFSHHEDRAGNPIHLMLILASLIFLFPLTNQTHAHRLVPYAIVLITGFLIHCLSVKWSVWHSRPHLPLFVLWSAFIPAVLLRRPTHLVVWVLAAILALSSILYMSRYASVLVVASLILSVCFKWQVWSRPRDLISFLVAGFLLAASTLYVFRNQTRPLVGIADGKTILNTNRTDQLFTFQSYRRLRDTYYSVVQFVNSQNCADVGIVTDTYGREYPFWVIFKETTRNKIRIEHINVKNASVAKTKDYAFAEFSPCAVIVVDKDDYTAPRPSEDVYTEAFSSGPIKIFTKRTSSL